MKKILPCRCHQITTDGFLYSRLIQFSKKGHQGIITKINSRWKKLSGHISPYGYIVQVVHGRTIRANRLIAMNFLPNPFAYPEVQHRNGIKTDNRLCNLKWGNQKHNAEDRARHHHTVLGIRSPHAKLNVQAVKFIRKHRNEFSLNRLAKKFHVSKKLILLVSQNKIWRHIG